MKQSSWSSENLHKKVLALVVLCSTGCQLTLTQTSQSWTSICLSSIGTNLSLVLRVRLMTQGDRKPEVSSPAELGQRGFAHNTISHRALGCSAAGDSQQLRVRPQPNSI